MTEVGREHDVNHEAIDDLESEHKLAEFMARAKYIIVDVRDGVENVCNIAGIVTLFATIGVAQALAYRLPKAVGDKIEKFLHDLLTSSKGPWRK